MTGNRTFTCTECGAKVSADVESTPKAFKFHVKREHRGKLENLDGFRDYPYRGFLGQEDIDKIQSDDVPI